MAVSYDGKSIAEFAGYGCLFVAKLNIMWKKNIHVFFFYKQSEF